MLQRFLARAVPASALIAALVVPPGARAEPGAPTSCTLAQVLERVRSSPRADALAGLHAAASAQEAQAAARPNPRLGLEVEDFTGSGGYSDFGQAQTTVTVSQPIELGGRRSGRMALASRRTAARDLRGFDETVRADVAAKQALVALLAAREELVIRLRDEKLAGEILAQALARTRGGAGSLVEQEQASVAAARAAVAVSQARRDVRVAEQGLVATWGGDASEAACFEGRLLVPADADAVADVAAIDEADEADEIDEPTEAARNPTIAMAEAEVELRRAEVAMARAGAYPDLSVGAGLRHLAGPDQVSVVTGLQLELPIFDRNQGNVQAAEHALFAAQARARLARQEVDLRVVRERESALAAHRRASMLESSAIPAARRAFTTLERAWNSGSASYLELVQARRDLVALELDRLDAVVEFHDSRASLEGLGGRVTSDLETTEPEDSRQPQTKRTQR